MQRPDWESGSLRPIITRAVCATGQAEVRHTVFLTPKEKVDNVLGVRLSDTVVKGRTDDGHARVEVRFAVHAWYSHGSGKATGVATQQVVHEERVQLSQITGVQRLRANEEVLVSLLDTPRVTDRFMAESEQGSVGATVSLRVGVDVIGEAKLWVMVYPVPDESTWKEPAEELGGGPAPSEADFSFLDHEDELELPSSE